MIRRSKKEAGSSAQGDPAKSEVAFVFGYTLNIRQRVAQDQGQETPTAGS
jgi:hypothetical protein